MSLAGSRSWWWFTGRFVVGVGSDVGYRLITKENPHHTALAWGVVCQQMLDRYSPRTSSADGVRRTE
jgi:hypothetical protein